jgi:hypothetical protein
MTEAVPLVRTRADLERISRNFGIPLEGLEEIVIVEEKCEQHDNNSKKP